MKKMIATIIALMLALTLCACGEQGNPYEKYAKYEELFESLEAGDYESANSYIQDFFGITEEPAVPTQPTTEPTEPTEPATEPTEPATEPTEPATEPTEPATEPTEPATKTISITLENWQEFFEIRSSIEENKNAFGEVDWYVYGYDFYLKEEWTSSIVDLDLAVEYSFTAGEDHYCIYNAETGTFEIKTDNEYAYTMTETNIISSEWFIDYGCDMIGDKFPYDECTLEGNIVTSGKQYFFLNVEIVRIQGTITITE